MAEEKKKGDLSDYIKLEIVTKDGNIVFSEDVAMANFPGEDGVFSVFPGHTPFLSTLKPTGLIKYQKKVDEETYNYFTVFGGFCEVNSTTINVITNASEMIEKIDMKRAEAAKQRAEQRLKQQPSEGIDIARAEAALQRALLRLSVAKL